MTFHIYTTVYLRNRNQNDNSFIIRLQNLVLRAYIIYVIGVYIIFETLHTFSTCYTMYQDVNSLIVSPGFFAYSCYCSYVTDEALTVRTLLLIRHSLFSTIGTGRP